MVSIYDPNGIIGHLTKMVIVEAISGSLGHKTNDSNPFSGAFQNILHVVDLEVNSLFLSVYCGQKQNVRHIRNNWIDPGERSK
jgi:hypothetical protein